MTEHEALPPEIAAFLDNLPDTLGELAAKLQITLLEASADRVVATMPVEGNRQPFGLLHGGATAALAETLGSIGASLHALPTHVPVGLDLNITHHRSARSGVVTGTATAITRGKTVVVHDIVVTDESGQRLSTARLTCLVRPR